MPTGYRMEGRREVALHFVASESSGKLMYHKDDYLVRTLITKILERMDV